MVTAAATPLLAAVASVLIMENHKHVDAGQMEKHVVWIQTAVNLIKVVVLFVEIKRMALTVAV